MRRQNKSNNESVDNELNIITIKILVKVVQTTFIGCRQYIYKTILKITATDGMH